MAKLFVRLIKRNISTTFETLFGKLNFWLKISRRGPYKIVKILHYLKMGQENKKIFFWKIEFLTENWQARTKLFVRKSFLAKLFVRLIKRTFLQHLRHFLENWTFDHWSKETFLQHLGQFLENWIFDGKSTGADLTKWGKKI